MFEKQADPLLKELKKTWDGFHTGPRLDVILASLEKNLGRDIQDLLYIHTHAPFIVPEVKNLPKGAKILEAGFGLGHWVFWFAKQGFDATGIDISPKAISIAKEYAKKNNVKNTHFIQGDVRSIPFNNEQFDYIFSFGVIEHFQDPTAIFREYRRILKPSGKIFISVPNTYSFHTLKRPLVKMLGLWKVGNEHSFSQNELRIIAQNSGFKVKRCGIMPSEEFFGRFPERIPLVGSIITKLLRRVSHFLESHQNVLGFWIYIVAQK